MPKAVMTPQRAWTRSKPWPNLTSRLSSSAAPATAPSRSASCYPNRPAIRPSITSRVALKAGSVAAARLSRRKPPLPAARRPRRAKPSHRPSPLRQLPTVERPPPAGAAGGGTGRIRNLHRTLPRRAVEQFRAPRPLRLRPLDLLDRASGRLNHHYGAAHLSACQPDRLRGSRKIEGNRNAQLSAITSRPKGATAHHKASATRTVL